MSKGKEVMIMPRYDATGPGGRGAGTGWGRGPCGAGLRRGGGPGRGMGGIRAALDLAETGRDVVLIDKDFAIGGLMTQLDRTFPANN